MNKLLGFYELRDSTLPSIPWREYKDNELDENILWTVRTAVHRGEDLNLPRCVGAEAKEAESFAKTMRNRYRENGMVIFYPYFLAEKSGTLNIFQDKVIIEAVKDDLWNLVTDGYKDVTIIQNDNDDGIQYIGDEQFLSKNELNELNSYKREIKRMFRDELIEGKSVLLEWSYAYKCSIEKKAIGDKYLVFYEARTV